nr:MAG TPA: hypothetical protein [Caudoviricetes sp.]
MSWKYCIILYFCSISIINFVFYFIWCNTWSFLFLFSFFPIFCATWW